MDTFDSMVSGAVGAEAVPYAHALLAFLASLAVLRIFKFVVVRQLKEMSKKTATDLDDLLIDVIDRVGWPFYFLASVYVGLHFITLPLDLQRYLDYLMFIVVVFYAVKAAQRVLDYITEKMVSKRQAEEPDSDTSIINLLNMAVKAVFWGVAVLLVLSNLGYDITTLLAGMGIGGIAIAFALQNVLADIFASFTIYFDKPFRKGDYIVLGADSGTVKKIGIKSTRLETLQGEELVVSNRELTETRVRNFKRMQKRRITFQVGVVYQTPVSKMKQVPGIIREIIVRHKLTEPVRVFFKEFGPSALIVEAVYFIKSNDYEDYARTQQEINISIMGKFQEEGLSFAYPTQTVFLGGQGLPKAQAKK